MSETKRSSEIKQGFNNLVLGGVISSVVGWGKKTFTIENLKNARQFSKEWKTAYKKGEELKPERQWDYLKRASPTVQFLSSLIPRPKDGESGGSGGGGEPESGQGANSSTEQLHDASTTPEDTNFQPKSAQQQLEEREKKLYEQMLENNSDISEQNLEDYLLLKKEVEKYVPELTKSFVQMCMSNHEYFARQIVNKKRKGSLNVGDFIAQSIVPIGQRDYEQILKDPRFYDHSQSVIENREEFTNVSIQLGLDMSRSMVSFGVERFKTAKRVAVLITLVADQVERTLRMHSAAQGINPSLSMDLTVHSFGQNVALLKPNLVRGANGQIQEADELANRIRMVNMMVANQDSTDDYMFLKLAHQAILNYKKPHTKHIVLIITDGGPSSPDLSKKFMADLAGLAKSHKTIIDIRSFLIGTTAKPPKFVEAYGDQNIICVEDVARTPAAVKSYLLGIAKKNTKTLTGRR